MSNTTIIQQSYTFAIYSVGHFLSSHYYLTLIYYDCALEPSECHLADGWGPTKQEDYVGYCIINETYVWYSVLNDRFGWWRIMLFDVNDSLDRHDKKLCSNTSHV